MNRIARFASCQIGIPAAHILLRRISRPGLILELVSFLVIYPVTTMLPESTMRSYGNKL
jgi:hypothetical protein